MKKLFIISALLLVLAAGCENAATWTITSGSLPDADPTPIVYEGDVALIGWGVAVPYYAGTPELHFHVAPESLKDLPQDFNFTKYNWDFKLENANQDFIKALGESNEQNIAEVLVDRIVIVQEGHPLMHLTETPGNSTQQQSE
ncbi:MAG: hypothetical protein WC285_02255 [Candidatus Gracilibacteria bacterium]|jgi:hypothetical protein